MASARHGCAVGPPVRTCEALIVGGLRSGIEGIDHRGGWLAGGSLYDAASLFGVV